jgi:hypothetical protein
MPLAVKHLGVETFLKVAKIGMADIDKYLTVAHRAEVIIMSESKTRSKTIIKRVWHAPNGQGGPHAVPSGS